MIRFTLPRLSLAVTLLLLLIATSSRAQTCSVSNTFAPNAAGTVMSSWVCDVPDDQRRYIPPPEPDVWGSIAISTSLKWGISWNFKSKEAAEAAAMARCKTASSVHDCKVAVTVADVCVSLALSAPQRLYAIGGPTGAVNYADANANLHCQRAGGKSCVIATSFCADGIRHIVPMNDAPATPYGRIRR